MTDQHHAGVPITNALPILILRIQPPLGWLPEEITIYRKRYLYMIDVQVEKMPIYRKR